MQIVNETTYWGIHIFAIVALLTFALIMLIASIGGITQWYEERDILEASTVVMTIFCITITLAIGWISFWLIKEGPDTEYDAIVTDYNEIYEQGYEVVDQKGDITIIKERD